MLAPDEAIIFLKQKIRALPNLDFKVRNEMILACAVIESEIHFASRIDYHKTKFTFTEKPQRI